jgi:hypothetical protein
LGLGLFATDERKVGVYQHWSHDYNILRSNERAADVVIWHLHPNLERAREDLLLTSTTFPFLFPSGFAQCATAEAHPPRTKLPRKTPPSTDMKYPTFIVMTANMLGLISAQYFQTI